MERLGLVFPFDTQVSFFYRTASVQMSAMCLSWSIRYSPIHRLALCREWTFNLSRRGSASVWTPETLEQRSLKRVPARAQNPSTIVFAS
jgi:hypothetical protein